MSFHNTLNGRSEKRRDLTGKRNFEERIREIKKGDGEFRERRTPIAIVKTHEKEKRDGNGKEWRLSVFERWGRQGGRVNKELGDIVYGVWK